MIVCISLFIFSFSNRLPLGIQEQGLNTGATFKQLVKSLVRVLLTDNVQ